MLWFGINTKLRKRSLDEWWKDGQRSGNVGHFGRPEQLAEKSFSGVTQKVWLKYGNATNCPRERAKPEKRLYACSTTVTEWKGRNVCFPSFLGGINSKTLQLEHGCKTSNRVISECRANGLNSVDSLKWAVSRASSCLRCWSPRCVFITAWLCPDFDHQRWQGAFFQPINLRLGLGVSSRTRGDSSVPFSLLRRPICGPDHGAKFSCQQPPGALKGQMMWGGSPLKQ